MSPFEVLIFGAQGSSFGDELRNLISIAKDPKQPGSYLSLFLHSAHSALLSEVETLQATKLGSLPALANWQSLSSLLNHHVDTGYRNAAVNGSLLCITQIAALLRFADSEVDQFFSQIRATSGYCSGTLPAAAFALSRSPLELVHRGVEAVRLSIWIGLSALAEAGQGAEPASWCLLCSGRDAQPERLESLVQAFNIQMEADPESCLRLAGATSETCSSLTGSPAFLELFKTVMGSSSLPPYITEILEPSASLRINFQSLPIFAPYHRSNLEASVADVLEKVKERQISLCAGNDALQLAVPLILPSGGSILDSTSSLKGGELMEKVLRSVFVDINRWDRVRSDFCSIFEQEQTLVIGAVDVGAKSLASVLASSSPSWRVEALSPGKSSDPRTVPMAQDSDQRIAIIGASCRLPGGADTLDLFWDLLADGKDCREEIPQRLFDWKQYQGLEKNGLNVAHGNFLRKPEVFDNKLFKISPREALQMDPQHRLVMHCCYEALEQGGYSPDQLECYRTERVGCFMGASSDDYRENASSDIGAYFITGNIRAFIPGHVSFSQDWEGPSNSIDTACTSSLVAVEAACDALISKQCDSALAGGVNIITQPQMFVGLEKAGLLSMDGRTRVFDDSADGFGRGDAVGVVLLKRYADAVADRDNIIGIIPGARSRFSEPSRLAEGLESLFRETCVNSNVPTSAVDYVEFHGSGKKHLEAAEMKAILSAYGASRPAHRPVLCGSSKPNVGYSEAASGVVSLLKGLCILKHNQIPPTIGIQTLNSEFPDLNQSSIQIPTEKRAMVRDASEGPQTISISNINFAGGISNLLLQSGTGQPVREATDPRDWHVVAIAAKTRSSAESLKSKYVSEFKPAKEDTLADIAYTSTARRVPYEFRSVGFGRTWEEARQSLAAREVKAAPQDDHCLPLELVLDDIDNAESLSFFEELRKTNASFAAVTAEVADICISFGLQVSLDDSSKDGSSILQFLYQISFIRLLRSWGLNPREITAKNVLSVISASFAGGVIGVEDAVYSAAILLKVGEDLTDNAKRLLAKRLLSKVKQSASRSKLTHESRGVVEGSGNGLLTLLGLADESEESTEADENEPSETITLTLGSSTTGSGLSLASGPQAAWMQISQTVGELWLRGQPVSWTAFHAPYTKAVRMPLDMPLYAFDENPYWMEFKDRGMLPSADGSDCSDSEESSEYEDEDTDVDIEDGPIDLSSKFPLLGKQLKAPSEKGQLTGYVFGLNIGESVAASVIAGHNVHGVGIIPASMYCEMALEAVQYLGITASLDDDQKTVSIENMEIIHPFILSEDNPSDQNLELRITKASENSLGLLWTCLDMSAGKTVEHASCTLNLIPFENSKQRWSSSVQTMISKQRDTFLRRSAVRSDDDDDEDGMDIASFDRGMAYRLFSKVVSYSPAFRGMRLVNLASDPIEAVSTVKIDPEALEAGDYSSFVVNPFLIDSLGQITGFLPNIGVASSDEVCIANGFDSVAFLDSFSEVQRLARINNEEPEFEVYATGKHLPGGVVSTDCFIFAKNSPVLLGYMLGVRFKRIKLALMIRLLPRNSTSTPKQHAAESGINKPIAPRREQIVEASQPAARPAQALPPAEIIIEAPVSQPQAELSKPPAQPKPPAVNDDATVNSVKACIIEELGISAGELTPDRQLADLGLDSLMALQILGSLREQTGLELPPSLFLDCPTFGAVSNFINQSMAGGSTEGSEVQAKDDAQVQSQAPESPEKSNSAIPYRLIKPVLLSRSAEKGSESQTPLFLFPDGSGTAAVYRNLKETGRDTYALTSPYLSGKADGWTLDSLCQLYIESIKLKKPEGPYVLGGWSFGGIVAFETARRLTERGEKVSSIVLIDPPAPRWEPLPSTTLKWVYGEDLASQDNEIGKKAPPVFSPEMVQHFSATLAAIAVFRKQCVPLPDSPPVILFNATDGLGKGSENNRMKEVNAAVEWLQNDRHGLGPHGWEELVRPLEKLRCIDVVGNHFSVVDEENAPTLCRAIRQELARVC
ncbi:ketoacyl-synt-domain-containing protein [Violaceomyces palustris]|uniref:Ketoacyl-synt-domain-containing protein n=1 Tax=Violaceomyces palustris TaxID=1673888 RepID=A0ACD0P6P0_9BASI|nr:ketoacyl-synt-domain-containing protein [Violaceomyces palustris]